MFAAETIQGRKLFAEIRHLLVFYISHSEVRVFDSMIQFVSINTSNAHILELG